MFYQLFLGSLVFSITIIVEAFFIGIAIRALYRFGPELSNVRRIVPVSLTLIGMTMWLLAALSISVWVWAGLFLAAGVFDTLEPALYFAGVSFTTLGFGDVLLPEEWRLLAGICAANGLLLFGLSTAFLVELFRRLDPARLRR